MKTKEESVVSSHYFLKLFKEFDLNTTFINDKNDIINYIDGGYRKKLQDNYNDFLRLSNIRENDIKILEEIVNIIKCIKNRMEQVFNIRKEKIIYFDDFFEILNNYGTQALKYISNFKTKKHSNPQYKIELPIEILQKLLENELIDSVENHKWIGEKNLCAYFTERYSPKKKIPQKDYETYFCITGLKSAKSKYKKNKKTIGRPTNYQIIDAII